MEKFNQLGKKFGLEEEKSLEFAREQEEREEKKEENKRRRLEEERKEEDEEKGERHRRGVEERETRWHERELN